MGTQRPNGTWTCPKCEYVNNPSSTRCEICSTARPSAFTQHTQTSTLPSSHGSSGILEWYSHVAWKDNLHKTSGSPFGSADTIQGTPNTPRKENRVADPILSNSLSSKSQSVAHSQISLSPTSKEALSPTGFPVLDPEAAKHWMLSLRDGCEM